MKNSILLLALIGGAGCVWDNASVEPHSVIRIDRSRDNSTAMAAEFFRTNNATTNAPGFGVAPYISTVPLAAAIVGINSVGGDASAPQTVSPAVAGSTTPSGATLPAAPQLTAPGTPIGTGASTASGTALIPSTGTTPGLRSIIGTPAGTASTGAATGLGSTVGAGATSLTTPNVNPPTGSSLGSGLGGTGTGAASSIGTTLNISNGVTNNSLVGSTNLFGPRP